MNDLEVAPWRNGNPHVVRSNEGCSQKSFMISLGNGHQSGLGFFDRKDSHYGIDDHSPRKPWFDRGKYDLWHGVSGKIHIYAFDAICKIWRLLKHFHHQGWKVSLFYFTFTCRWFFEHNVVSPFFSWFVDPMNYRSSSMNPRNGDPILSNH